MSVRTLPNSDGLSRTPIDGVILARNPVAMDFLNLLCALLAQVEPMVQQGAFFIALDQVPVYANNAAALAGGLSAGNIYRSSANPSVLAIVT